LGANLLVVDLYKIFPIPILYDVYDKGWSSRANRILRKSLENIGEGGAAIKGVFAKKSIDSSTKKTRNERISRKRL